MENKSINLILDDQLKVIDKIEGKGDYEGEVALIVENPNNIPLTQGTVFHYKDDPHWAKKVELMRTGIVDTGRRRTAIVIGKLTLENQGEEWLVFTEDNHTSVGCGSTKGLALSDAEEMLKEGLDYCTT